MLTRDHLLHFEGWVIDRNTIQIDARFLIQSQLKSIERLPVSSMGLDQTPEKDLLSKVYSAYRYWATFSSEGSLKRSRFITLLPPREMKLLQITLCPIYNDCQIWLTSSKGKLPACDSKDRHVYISKSLRVQKEKMPKFWCFASLFVIATSQNDSFLRRGKARPISERTKENWGN